MIEPCCRSAHLITEMWADKVGCVSRTGVAGAAAGALLCGCTAFGPAAHPTQRAVESILDGAGQSVFTRLVLTPDAHDIQVAVRVDGAEIWWTQSGAGDRVVQPSVVGASRPDAIDFDALDAQLASVAQSCDLDPQLAVFVAATGALVADSTCDGRLTATSLRDGEPASADIDLASVEGIDRLLAEVSAALPNQRAYQISLPGPASPRGDTARAEGGPWVLADGTTCMVSYLRAGQDAATGQVRSFRCDGYGQQTVDYDAQQPFDPAALSAADIRSAMADGLAASGFDPQMVSYYGIYELLGTGTMLAIITSDGNYHESSL